MVRTAGRTPPGRGQWRRSGRSRALPRNEGTGCLTEERDGNSRNRKQVREKSAGESGRKGRRSRGITRNSSCLPDFAGHGRQRATPKFATVGRPESGFQSDQKRRTSQQAGKVLFAALPPMHRVYGQRWAKCQWGDQAPFRAGSRFVTRLPAMVKPTPATTRAAPAYCSGVGRSRARRAPSSNAIRGLT
jgi:hypothetical protein